MALMCFLVSVCQVCSVHADVVMLKNGDRITGRLVKIQGETLELKSDILGSLSIPVAKVETYSVEKVVAVVIKGKEPAEGSLELGPSGEWRLTAKGQVRPIPMAEVDTIMPADAYHKLVEANPKLWQAWKGSASLGESIQHGNQQTSTFTTVIQAVRERPEAPVFRSHFRTNWGLTTLLAHAKEEGNTVTSRTFSTNLREDYLFTPRTFVFGLAQVDHVSTEGLYLRQTYGGGFGNDVFKSSHTTVSLIGGLTFQHQKFFTGESNQAATGLVGEKFGEQFTKRIRLDHNLNFYPIFSEGGQYRFDTATVFSIKLYDRFSLNTSVIDLYLSNPPEGNRKNNVTFSTGIGFSF